jgi:hypothetical protein
MTSVGREELLTRGELLLNLVGFDHLQTTVAEMAMGKQNGGPLALPTFGAIEIPTNDVPGEALEKDLLDGVFWAVDSTVDLRLNRRPSGHGPKPRSHENSLTNLRSAFLPRLSRGRRNEWVSADDGSRCTGSLVGDGLARQQEPKFLRRWFL